MAVDLWAAAHTTKPQRAGAAQTTTAGYAIGLLTWMLAASAVIAVKMVEDEMPPWTMAFFRVLITALLLLPVVLRYRAETAAFFRLRGPEALFIGALGLGLTQGVMYSSLHMTAAINVSMVFACAPMLTLLFARLMLNEALNGWQALGSLIAFTGIIVVSVQGSPERLSALQFGIGEVVAFGSALLFASYTVLLKRAQFELPALPLLVIMLCGGALATLPFFAWEYVRDAHANLARDGYLALLYCAAIGGALMYFCYNKSIEILGAAQAGTLVYSQMIFVAIFAWIILGERLEWYHYFGAALVASGVFLVISKRPKAATVYRN